MDEIGFVLKSFLVSCFAVFIMQMKMGSGQTVEGWITSHMQNAWGTKVMKDMGKGATRVTASVYNKTVGEVLNGKNSPIHKLTDIKGEMKKSEEAAKKREQQLMDIENR